MNTVDRHIAVLSVLHAIAIVGALIVSYHTQNPFMGKVALLAGISVIILYWMFVSPFQKTQQRGEKT